MMHRSFFQYVTKQDVGLREMAQLSRTKFKPGTDEPEGDPGQAIEFDKYDELYLKQFQPAVPSVWAQAIAKRYSPLMLQHPEIDTQDIKLTTQVDQTKPELVAAFKEAGWSGGKQVSKTFKVKTYAKELVEKIDSLYYPEKINMDTASGLVTLRGSTKNDFQGTAYEAIQWVKDKSQPRPALHLNKALREKAKEGRKQQPLPDSITDRSRVQHDPAHHRDFMKHNMSDRRPITLDDDDRAFLAWFDKHYDGVDPKVVQRKKVAALTRRYNDTDRGLVNDPQANQSIAGGEPGQFFTSIPGVVDTDEDDPIPVSAQRLRQKIEKLRTLDVDLRAKPLPPQTAPDFLKNGWWKPWKGQHGNKDLGGSFTREMTSINQYIDKQNAYLAYQDGKGEPAEPAGVFDRNINGFNPDVQWMDILKQEAKYIARKLYRDKRDEKAFLSIQASGFDEETLEAEVLDYLASEEMVSKPEYASQNFRLNQAYRHMRDVIGDTIAKQKGNREQDLLGKRKHVPKKRFGGPNQEVEDEPVGAGDESEPEMDKSDDDEDGGHENKIIRVLLSHPDSKLLPPDTDWEQLADDYKRLLSKWHEDQRQRMIKRQPYRDTPNNTELATIAKDVLAPHIPTMAMAASKPPGMQPKIDKAQARPEPEPQPDYSKGYYAGGDDDAADDEFIKNRRRR